MSSIATPTLRHRSRPFVVIGLVVLAAVALGYLLSLPTKDVTQSLQAPSTSITKNEASTAAAISTARPAEISKDEASVAVSVSPRPVEITKDEASTAATVGGSHSSTNQASNSLGHRP